MPVISNAIDCRGGLGDAPDEAEGGEVGVVGPRPSHAAAKSTATKSTTLG